MAAKRLKPDDALLVVDVQNDFCPGGALPVDEGDQVVPVLNRWIARAVEAGSPVFASRDWHPPDHMSFHERGGPWPRHCVQHTPGAEFHPALELPESVRVINKGMNPERENYSAFHDTDLARQLKELGVRSVWVGGLALDVCVRATVLDGIRQGFAIHLILPATRSISANGGKTALDEMRNAGATIHDGEDDA